VILADDHPMMLGGLRRLLESELDVVATASDGQSLLEAAARLDPDLVITDLSMPELDGIEATRRLRAVLPSLKVVILSIHEQPSWVRAAFEAGACGYLTKTCVPEEIETAVRVVLDGRFYLSPTVARDTLLPRPKEQKGRGAAPHLVPSEPAVSLTPRELNILRLVGGGLSNKEIALKVGMAVSTVRTHLHSVYWKLGFESRVELALYAAHLGDRAVLGEGDDRFEAR
jgi:DNA-binding NarL/FixJ family response regulator